MGVLKRKIIHEVKNGVNKSKDYTLMFDLILDFIDFSPPLFSNLLNFIGHKL